MFGMRYSTIFKNRWWAVLWAIGICYSAASFVGPKEAPDGNSVVATDATGAPIQPSDVKAFKDVLGGM